MIHDTRLRNLNDRPVRDGGRYVLYWMQASGRAGCNHALEHAVRRADELGLPVVVCFGLMDGYPEANERHYVFMLEGLADAVAALEKRGIKFVCKHVDPPDAALHYGKEAALIVADRGYMRHQVAWRQKVGRGAACAVVQVEAEVVVPVETASDKHEYAAHTLRRKIDKLRAEYLVPLEEVGPEKSSLDLKIEGDIDVSDPATAASKLRIDRSVGKSAAFAGGLTEARRRLGRFIDAALPVYDAERNDPTGDKHSYLSAYLHFGQISPVEIGLAVRDAKARPAEDKAAYLEELIVRRELSMNFVNFTPDYDQYSSLPAWSKKTLAEHANDERPAIYSRDELESAATADEYWNAATREMKITGFMQNYLRMYWGKKVLEWSESPEVAFDNVMYLNNKYFLCGRDPNSYTNVAWIFGLHDRPWQERKIFGKVRYMNAKGLERKFKIQKYVEQVAALSDESSAG